MLVLRQQPLRACRGVQMQHLCLVSHSKVLVDLLRQLLMPLLLLLLQLLACLGLQLPVSLLQLRICLRKFSSNSSSMLGLLFPAALLALPQQLLLQ